MKKVIVVLAVLALSLTGCNGDNQSITDAVSNTTDAVANNVTGSGVDIGSVAAGALGGMVLGSMMSGNKNPSTIIINKEKKVYNYKPSSSSFRSSSSSSRSFSGGRR